MECRCWSWQATPFAVREGHRLPGTNAVALHSAVGTNNMNTSKQTASVARPFRVNANQRTAGQADGQRGDS